LATRTRTEQASATQAARSDSRSVRVAFNHLQSNPGLRGNKHLDIRTP